LCEPWPALLAAGVGRESACFDSYRQNWLLFMPGPLRAHISNRSFLNSLPVLQQRPPHRSLHAAWQGQAQSPRLQGSGVFPMPYYISPCKTDVRGLHSPSCVDEGCALQRWLLWACWASGRVLASWLNPRGVLVRLTTMALSAVRSSRHGCFQESKVTGLHAMLNHGG
jgi:hypothetical protein